MYIYLLQDWFFFEAGVPGPSTLVQPAATWLDVGLAKDLVFWLQVASVDDGGVPGLQLTYETAAVSEEAIFKAVANPITITASMTPLLTTVLKNSGGTSVPIGNWVRWKLSHTTVDVRWHVEFRIYCAATTTQLLDEESHPRLVRECGCEALRTEPRFLDSVRGAEGGCA